VLLGIDFLETLAATRRYVLILSGKVSYEAECLYYR
jgi:hypothetical protein